MNRYTEHLNHLEGLLPRINAGESVTLIDQPAAPIRAVSDDLYAAATLFAETHGLKMDYDGAVTLSRHEASK